MTSDIVITQLLQVEEFRSYRSSGVQTLPQQTTIEHNEVNSTCIMGTGKLIRFWIVGTVLVIHV